jgi:hypothetical protein
MCESDILSLDDAEKAYMLLVSLYLDSDAEHRELMRKKWDFGYAWKFPNPFRLACRIGERYEPQQRIEASLAYESLEDSPLTREHLVGLAIEYHSCLLAGIDPSVPFTKVAQASTDNVANRIIGFLQRPAESLSLEAFMLTPRKDKNGEWEIPWPV